MIADYTNNPKLFEQCITLIDDIFPGCKAGALTGIQYGASWREASTPFIVEEEEEIIAHAGVWPITLMLNGKKHQTASIHGVCVKPKHRGKGYFKQLMQEAIQYVEKNFDSSIFFTTKPYLYTNYPYRIMLPEYDFVINDKIKSGANGSDIRELNLENKDDLKIVHDLLANRVPLSNQFSIIGENGRTLFILNSLHRKIYYSEQLKAIIVFDILNDTLYIKEIVSQEQCQIRDIVAIIPGHFEKIILQFCPDRFLKETEHSPILAGPECCIMASKNFTFNEKFFRYPELYAC